MYAREVGEQTLTFGVSGMLYKDVLITFDQETENMWNQVDGRSIFGPLAGRQLTALPAIHAPWKQWKTLYPERQVLSKSAITTNAYSAYNGNLDLGTLGRRNEDDRLTGKERILGIVNDVTSIAFPVDDVRRSELVQAEVGTQPIVLIATSDHLPVLAYDQRIAGGTLTFEMLDDDPVHVRDIETGTQWDVRDGLGISGPLADQLMERVVAHSAFWFGWRGFFPATRRLETRALAARHASTPYRRRRSSRRRKSSQ
jgi:hypothetical protein